MGVISPSKLRMKLLGAHNSKKKEGGSHSSRTSPSKLEEMEHAKNHLLTSDPDDEAASGSKPVANAEHTKSELSAKDVHSKDKCDASRAKPQITRSLSYQCQAGSSLSTVHPMRPLDEDGNGYDSGHDNGSTSSFEFHRGERSLHHSAVGPFTRHLPSKWNDAEKWIVNRQAPHPNVSKKNVQQNQGGRPVNSGWMKVAPDSMIADTKRVVSGNHPSQIMGGKFFFVPNCLNGVGESADFSQGGDEVSSQKEKDHKEVSSQEKPISETPVIPTVESVSMRDVGTEMTPIPSQDPSRTGTPLGATTPSRSPISSMPSTPKRGPAPSYGQAITADEKDCQKKGCKKELSEKELQMKTRQEIAALGIKLGKMNIASWASKHEAEHSSQSPQTIVVEQQLKADYQARAAAWEEIEKAKHTARYKQQELKLQAWESHQRAKLEAKLRKIEVQVEQMRIQAQEKIVEKLAVTRRLADERRADAEARRNERAARTSQQVERIRQTGRVPRSHHSRCLSCFL